MARTTYGGKAAIVTGGGSGIGRALGAGLVARGATVVLADVDGDAASAAAASLGDAARGCALDVRDLAATLALVDEVAGANGGLDFFFANAGIALGGPTHELTPEHWDRMIDVNLRGAVNSVLAAYPAMREQGRGHMVLTASGAGLAPPPFVVPYAMAKHGVVGLGVGLRPEAALAGVHVSVLCPGPVDTPILDRAPPADLPATASPTLTAREYLGTVRQRPIPPEAFADKALDAVARNRRVICIPRSTGALWRLSVVSQGAFDRITRSLAASVRRELDTRAADTP